MPRNDCFRIFLPLQISGKMATNLKLSLTRQQYEQLIETFNNILENTEKSNVSMEEPPFGEAASLSSLLPNIAEDSELRSGVSALDLDPALRAKMLQRHSTSNFRRSVVYDTPAVTYNGERSLLRFVMKIDRLTLFLTGFLWFGFSQFRGARIHGRVESGLRHRRTRPGRTLLPRFHDAVRTARQIRNRYRGCTTFAP